MRPVPAEAECYLEAWLAWVQLAARTQGAAARCLADLLSLVLAAGGTIHVCGNGGSAADAQHFAAELVGRFMCERDPLPVVALPANAALLTALANDRGAEELFARQIDALAGPGDCVLVISTSGRSPNILAALRAGRRRGALTAALVGPDGLHPSAAPCCDYILTVDDPLRGCSAVTPHVQEVHLALLHYVAYLVETAAAPTGGPCGARGRRGRRPAVFLDRDGTLVEERGYITDANELALLPGAGEAVRLLNEAGLAVVLTTNQSAVARGMVNETRLNSLHGRLQELLGGHGARLDAVYHCPHHPRCGGGVRACAGPIAQRSEENGGAYRPCACRKPLPGMMLRAAADLGLDLGSSFVIGDNWTDLQAAAACGATGVLVRTGSGTRALAGPCPLAPESAGRWFAAAGLEEAVMRAVAGGWEAGP